MLRVGRRLTAKLARQRLAQLIGVGDSALLERRGHQPFDDDLHLEASDAARIEPGVFQNQTNRPACFEARERRAVRELATQPFEDARVGQLRTSRLQSPARVARNLPIA